MIGDRFAAISAANVRLRAIQAAYRGRDHPNNVLQDMVQNDLWQRRPIAEMMGTCSVQPQGCLLGLPPSEGACRTAAGQTVYFCVCRMALHARSLTSGRSCLSMSLAWLSSIIASTVALAECSFQ